ncbi:hypothetical protein ACEWY4_006868 [Coilia grayii]|uniref:Taste receptor type 2 n=1 Tax=Coilia grayii TaxID=363190 RepID=A0ABD1KEM5_9TELE
MSLMRIIIFLNVFNRSGFQRMNVSHANTTLELQCLEGACYECRDEIYVGICVYQAMAISCFLLIVPIHVSLIWQGQYCDWRTTPMQLWGLNANILELVFCLDGFISAIELHFCVGGVFDIILYMLLSLTWMGRPLLHTWVCVEMYVAVIFPTKYSRFKAMKFKLGTVGAVWTVSLSYSLFNVLRSDSLCLDPVMLSVLCFSITAMLFCCASILWELRRPGPGNGQRAGQDIQKQRAFMAILKLLGLMILTYTPLLLMHSMHSSSKQFSCNISYALTAFYVFGVMLMTLHGLYKEGNLSCFKKINTAPLR